jgi:hypothetical protein
MIRQVHKPLRNPAYVIKQLHTSTAGFYGSFSYADSIEKHIASVIGLMMNWKGFGSSHTIIQEIITPFVWAN